MKVRLTVRARRDLEALRTYFLRENPVAGDHLLEAIRRSLGRLEMMPLLGKRTDIGAVRCPVVPRSRHAIFYEVRGDEIAVLTIFHASRDPAKR